MNQSDGRIFQLQCFLGNGQQAKQVIKEVAQAFNVTPLYLKQLFKNQTGQSISQFDKDLRLDRAKYLIETTHMRLNEIGDEVGFGEHCHDLGNEGDEGIPHCP